MNKFFIWYKMDGDLLGDQKSRYSSSIHNFIFKNGIKLTAKSNAFFYKSSLSTNQISEKITEISNENIKLIVINLDNGEHQGWLNQEQWSFLED